MSELNDLTHITSKLLPPTCDLFTQQKEAVHAEGSIDVVAGPGSGKTTVLIVKCGLLLEQPSTDNRGICLITHTNIALEEIKTGLDNLGMGEVEYPHFVGTIQEFFNRFFARKAFRILTGSEHFRVIDDDEYQQKFEEQFDLRKPKNYDARFPKFKPRYERLEISKDHEIKIISKKTRNYKVSFEKSIETLFHYGILTNHQCLELSNWYIEKYKNQVKKAIASRFNYVFLDEAQDTNFLQYKMLNDLFSNSDLPFQKFGDPYQALYNIFEGNQDTWKPTLGINYQEISESSRFGHRIADKVKNVCIEKYDTFTSLDIVDSFAPCYIKFEDEHDLTEKYQKLIYYFESISDSFKQSKKKDTFLAPFHSDLERHFSVYTKPSNSVQKNQSTVMKITNFITNLLSKKAGMTFKEIKNKIDSDLSNKIAMSNCIKEILSNKFDHAYFFALIESILYNTTKGKIKEFLNSEDKKAVVNFRKLLNASEPEYSRSINEETDFYIGTVHSVKGETHRSTALILDTVFNNFQTGSSLSMIDLIANYLEGNYIDPYSIDNEDTKDATIKCLKLAYVAFSRPTHLLAIAIPKTAIVDEQFISNLNEFGWQDADDLIVDTIY